MFANLRVFFGDSLVMSDFCGGELVDVRVEFAATGAQRRLQLFHFQHGVARFRLALTQHSLVLANLARDFLPQLSKKLNYGSFRHKTSRENLRDSNLFGERCNAFDFSISFREILTRCHNVVLKLLYNRIFLFYFRLELKKKYDCWLKQSASFAGFD